MTDLPAFLRAQWDADEEMAGAATPGPWFALDSGVVHEPGDGCETWPVSDTDSGRDREDRLHIAAWDPARVLAEVAAKRALIDDVFAYEATIDGEWGCCHNAQQIEAGECTMKPDEIKALRILAAPYVGRDGWREEWGVT